LTQLLGCLDPASGSRQPKLGQGNLGYALTQLKVGPDLWVGLVGSRQKFGLELGQGKKVGAEVGSRQPKLGQGLGLDPMCEKNCGLIQYACWVDPWGLWVDPIFEISDPVFESSDRKISRKTTFHSKGAKNLGHFFTKLRVLFIFYGMWCIKFV